MMKYEIYDDGGKCADRYTLIVLDEMSATISRLGSGYKLYPALGFSTMPYHPQGFCQHTEAMRGRHLGKRISLKDLNEDCQKVVLEELEAYK